MAGYILNTDQERTVMLEQIKRASLDDLYADLPANLKLKEAMTLPEGQSEFAVMAKLKALSMQNKVYTTVLRGAGIEHHHIPAVVKQLSNREEFVSAYTPYQSELSQGILQSIFEYQTQMCELTGMDVCNASVYDGATAAAEAMQMVVERTRRVILIPDNMHPHVLQTMRTYAQWANIRLMDLKTSDGRIDLNDLITKCDEHTAGVFFQHPNYFGLLEDVFEISRITHNTQAKLVQYTNPLTCAYLKSPRAMGADIAIGEAQSLGIPMSFGGPYLGFMAASADLVRRLPGRIAGQTVDSAGARAFTLTLQAREQHIRREKASSSICSNQALMALVASMYCASMGPQGLKEVAEAGLRKAHYLLEELEKIGFKRKYDGPFFNEFVVVSPIKHAIIERVCDEMDILAGLGLSSHESLWCVTETTNKATLDQLIVRLKEVVQ